ncbi:MAG: outer membrane beta-barrel protein [Bacteriovoracaceae bacterium]
MKKILYLLFFYHSLALAQINDVGLTLGNLTEFVANVQVDEKGGKNYIEFKPYMSFFIRHDFNESFSLLPEIGITYPMKGESPNTKKTIYMIRLDLGYRFYDFIAKAGTALFVTQIKGSGGTEKLNNGTSYDEFYLPAESHTARNYTINLGLEYFIIPELSVKSELFVFSMFENVSRQFSYAIALTYHFGEIHVN